jgi:hypothetical protein
MTMIINRSQKIVLLAAFLIAVGSTFFLLARGHSDALSYQCYKTTNGWGYDILSGTKIVIHQPFMPGVPGRSGFNQQQHAATVARIVIEKIKSGEMPAISHQQLQRLGVLHTQVK